MTRRWTGLLLTMGLSALLSACASPPRTHHVAYPVSPPPPAPPAAPAQPDTSHLVPPPDTSKPASGSVEIDPRIVAACGQLPQPRFEFDSSAIAGTAADQLHVVATCFKSGPLKGRHVKLVGRADPRGAPAYNLALGQSRAGSVARYLEAAGIPSSQITTTSRGAIDAIGTDQATWALDRRVDLVLGD